MLSLILRAISEDIFCCYEDVAGYVTNNNRKRDRKEAQKGLNKNLKEENLNRLLE